MRRLQISKDAKEVATKYQEMICSKYAREVEHNLNEVVQDILGIDESLGKVEVYDQNTTLNPGDVKKYINLIISRYNELLILSPKEFRKEINTFERIIPKNLLNSKIRIESGKRGDSLATKIINAMMYDRVREKVFPKIARQLKIKTCVYCNTNYTITDANGEGYYDLDHWKPKALYPFLCTSFYNLQPSCPSCNRRKGKDDGKFFHLWKDTNDRRGLDVFCFQLEPESIVNYLLKIKAKEDDNDLRISISEASMGYRDLVRTAKERFRLEARYEEHVDVAEEIVWKRQIYNDSYLASTEGLLKKIYDGDRTTLKSIRDRFILGNYGNPEEVHMRPLAKMTQDIAKQLGLL